MRELNSKTLASILIGTILEWYDFSLLGSMAPIIAQLFFPSKVPTLSLLATFSVFASGFIARPLGGVLFGHLGDRKGRKYALSLTIILMALPTTLMGLLPTYQNIGMLAPIILIVLRLVQGAASSGEYPGAICFLTEIAPANKRGLWGSISMFGVGGGILLGSVFSYILTTCLSNDALYSWGWRIPFIVGLPLGIIGFYLRYRVTESKIFAEVHEKQVVHKMPFKQVLQFNFLNLNRIILLFSLGTTTFYMSFVYIISYFVSTHRLTLSNAFLFNILSSVCMLFFIPIFGYLSDKWNRKIIMLIGAFCLCIFSYPIFKLFLSNDLHQLLLGQLLLAFLIAMFVGPVAATSAEIFSTATRYSGVAVALNVGASIFGGTSPLIATYLVHISGKEIMPCIYPMLVAFLAFFAVLTLKNNQKHALNEII